MSTMEDRTDATRFEMGRKKKKSKYDIEVLCIIEKEMVKEVN